MSELRGLDAYLERPYRQLDVQGPDASGVITIERPVPSTSGVDGEDWVLLRCEVSVNDGRVDGSDYPLTELEESHAVYLSDEWSDDR